MKLTQIHKGILAFGFLFAGAMAQAASVSGTITNKTTGKPAAGDTVVLVDVLGHTVPEAAEALAIGLEAAKSRLHRARSTVRESLAA